MGMSLGVNIHDVKEVKIIDERLKREVPTYDGSEHFWTCTLQIIPVDETSPPIHFTLFRSDGYRIKHFCGGGEELPEELDLTHQLAVKAASS